MPERWKVLDGSQLKLIAVFTMFVDHTAAVLLEDTYIIVFRLGERTVDLYEVMRTIGRICFPLFAFLLVEGFLHTPKIRRYARDLLTFAFISEIPWNLEHSGTLLYSSQNVMFTLFFGLIGMWILRDYQGDGWKRGLFLIGLFLLTVLFRADYGSSGFGFILMLYLLRNQKLCQAVIGSCFLSSGWRAGLAFIPINMYNGQRGFVRNNLLKYLFYLIYPCHLFALYWIRRMTIGY